MDRYLKLTGNCVICLPVLTLFVTMLDAKDKLRVGVPEQSMSVAKIALQDTGLLSSFELLPIKAENNESSLADINDTYFNVSSLNLDAVVGPYSIPLDLIAESLDFPYLCTSFDFTLVKRTSKFEMLPDTALAGQAMIEVMKAFGWTKIALFYDSYGALSLVEQLMTNHNVLIQAWRLSIQAKRGQANSALFQMRKNRLETILILCNKENTMLILDQALNLAMLATPPNQWMFYDPGLESLDVLTKYTQIQVNFTVVSLLDFSDTLKSSSPSKIEFALTSDAFKILSASKAILVSQSEDGNRLNSAAKQVFGDGHTGILAFDHQGRRKNVTLMLTTVEGDKTIPRGMWYSNPPSHVPNLNLNTAVIALNQTRPLILSGMKVKVVAVKVAPFLMLRKDYETRNGNDRFKGYSVDLIKHIAKALNFEYELYLVPDGKFGSKMKNGQWNGIIGELIAGNATMSVAPLTITAERETAVDFTKPFMTTFVSVLMSIPTYEQSYLQILSPFSLEIWILIFIVFIIVSLILYVLENIGRILNKNVNRDEPEVTLGETIWFTFGSLVQGNIESFAISLPGRILTSAWWVLGLILVSSYTANLAAFLTAQNIATPIKSVADLAQQTKIKYGAEKDTSTENFFKNTQIGYFSKMWIQMSEVEPDSMVDTQSEAIKKVKSGDFAFFEDSRIIKHLTQIDCDLMEIGPAFNPKGYGIGVPPGASYLDQLSMEILRMSDSGILENLRSKWWDISTCPHPGSEPREISSLQLENVAGIFFIIVVGGIVIASLVCIVMYSFPGLFRIPEVSLKHLLEETLQDTGFPPSPTRSPLQKSATFYHDAVNNSLAENQAKSFELVNLQPFSTKSSTVVLAAKHTHSNSPTPRLKTPSPVTLQSVSEITSPTLSSPLNKR